MARTEIIEKAKKQFYYRNISPYYYGLKKINSEKIKTMSYNEFIKNIEKIRTSFPKNGDLVRIDNVAVKCFYNENNDILLIAIM